MASCGLQRNVGKINIVHFVVSLDITNIWQRGESVLQPLTLFRYNLYTNNISMDPLPGWMKV